MPGIFFRSVFPSPQHAAHNTYISFLKNISLLLLLLAKNARVWQANIDKQQQVLSTHRHIT